MTPILYSFRRCPYAMRARLALHVAQTPVELREIKLRDKPAAFLQASASGTVPCLVRDAEVLDESLDIMRWALGQHDPEAWLAMPDAGWDVIAQFDGPFKHALDRTKYATRYPDEDPSLHRAEAAAILSALDAQMGAWIYQRPSIADFAVLPFVRQFAFIDKPWFDAQPWGAVQAWLARFLTSPRFADCMVKPPLWQDGAAVFCFPEGRRNV